MPDLDLKKQVKQVPRRILRSAVDGKNAAGPVFSAPREPADEQRKPALAR
jgi:hypothetical protein